MALFGKLIKKGIELNDALRFENSGSPKDQPEQLRKLLEKAENTAFGKYYGFSAILKSDDIEAAYKAAVPVSTYDEINERWWMQQRKLPDITWPGRPGYFAVSSGTTGKESKKIPVTDAMLQSIKDVGTELVRALPAYDFPESLFEAEILMLGSSADLNRSPEGFLEGEISGINVSNFPDWYGTFYKPGKEIARIDNWEERVQRIAENAPQWNIGAVAGIPSWILLMLKEVIRYNKADTIHDIWPSFSVYASGGVAFDMYRKDLDALCAKPVTVMDTYLASEGFFAYTARPGTLSMKLAAAHGIYFEFIPFDERGVDETGQIIKNPVSHRLTEVEHDTDYVLVISTCAGAWRYVIGDTVKFTSVKNREIKITGRTKFFLNATGSQLSEEKMDAAIREVSDKLGITASEYAVAAVKNEAGDYIHQWVVVSDDSFDESSFAEALDAALKEANKNYAVARGKALKGLDVQHMRRADYLAYLEKDKKVGGQTKTPKVMSAEKMEDFLSAVPA